MALPSLAGKKEVFMAVNDILAVFGQAIYAPVGALSARTYTINGELMPAFSIAPGETQVLRIANLASNSYYNMSIDGHVMTVLEVDGGLVWDTYETSSLFLFGGRRYTVALKALSVPGDYTIRSHGFDGGLFGNYPPVELGTLRVEGAVDTCVVDIPAHPRARHDLLSNPIAAKRSVILSQDLVLPLFYINGDLYPLMTHGDKTQVVVNTTEEWLVAVTNNPTNFLNPHVFHIHTNPIVVVGRGSWDYKRGVTSFEAVNPTGPEDVVFIDPGAYVIFRTEFVEFTGMSAFHCHLLFHEDWGMMSEHHINPCASLEVCRNIFWQEWQGCNDNYRHTKWAERRQCKLQVAGEFGECRRKSVLCTHAEHGTSGGSTSAGDSHSGSHRQLLVSHYP